MSDTPRTKREWLERVVKELNLDTNDPFTLLFANACALLDQRDHLKRELVEAHEDAERYRWFRDHCEDEQRFEILEVSEGVADHIDHHIDKGRCGL